MMKSKYFMDIITKRRHCSFGSTYNPVYLSEPFERDDSKKVRYRTRTPYSYIWEIFHIKRHRFSKKGELQFGEFFTIGSKVPDSNTPSKVIFRILRDFGVFLNRIIKNLIERLEITWVCLAHKIFSKNLTGEYIPPKKLFQSVDYCIINKF